MTEIDMRQALQWEMSLAPLIEDMYQPMIYGLAGGGETVVVRDGSPEIPGSAILHNTR